MVHYFGCSMHKVITLALFVVWTAIRGPAEAIAVGFAGCLDHGSPAGFLVVGRPTGYGLELVGLFAAGVNEEQTLANAQYMKEKLLSHGYNLITVDIQWYEPKAHGPSYRPHAVLEMDSHGRLLRPPIASR